MKGISDCPPHLMTVGVIVLGRKSFSDWICLRGHWTQGGHAVPCGGFSMSRNHYLMTFNSGFPFRILLEPHLTGSSIRTPKYSCRDYCTGGYPMKNYQQEPELKPLWGLAKKPLSNKSKEKRILETVNRMITRIQNDERKCL